MRGERLTFLEFFCGGGMARLGLGPHWRCLLANDADPVKCSVYRANFGSADLVEGDIASLSEQHLPRMRADLAWASFPCQDLSVAGARAGLAGSRSGLFFAFRDLIAGLGRRAPRLLVAENVTGLLTSNGGEDFRRVVEDLAALGYWVSALVVDARAFLPQSRPRLFIFAFADEAPAGRAPVDGDDGAPAALRAAVGRLSPQALRRWRWIDARPRGSANARLRDMVDLRSPDWSAAAADRAMAQMAPHQRAAVEERCRAGGLHVGAAFRRIRIEAGERRQRVEARFDGLAGCLRTPAGGSSRQMLLKIEDGAATARLLSPREAARLMGLPEDYALPAGTTAALKLAGDGVAAPVVRWIAEAILEPALRPRRAAA